MKHVLERVLERRIRKKVKIDEMQFGFMPGRRTTDVLFIARQLQEKYMEKRKKLFLGFVDLEKAFDGVPREVVKWALRKLGVEEWLIRVVMAMYKRARTAVRTKDGNSGEGGSASGVGTKSTTIWSCDGGAGSERKGGLTVGVVVCR